MFLVRTEKSAKAVALLFFATAFWGASFVAMKALSDCQRQIIPNASTWFLSAISLVVRFGVGALAIAVFSWRTVRTTTRSEFKQGLALGLLGGLGLLFQ